MTKSVAGEQLRVCLGRWSAELAVKYLLNSGNEIIRENPQKSKDLNPGVPEFKGFFQAFRVISGCINERRKKSKSSAYKAVILLLRQRVSGGFMQPTWGFLLVFHFYLNVSKKIKPKMTCDLVRVVAMLKIKPIVNQLS